MSGETATARQEAEKAYASARIEEAEATTIAETAATAAATVGGKNIKTSPGAPPPGAAPAAGTGEANTIPEQARGDPSGAKSNEGLPIQRAWRASATTGGVLDSKRQSTSTVTSDPKRRRRSRNSIGAAAATSPSRQDGGGGDDGGGGGGVAGSSNSGAAGAGLSRTAPGSGASLGLVPHPVFARRETAAREGEASGPSAADVVGMAREAEELSGKVQGCEGKLAAATITTVGISSRTRVRALRTAYSPR